MKILERRQMGTVQLVLIEREGEKLWVPAYVGEFCLKDIDSKVIAEYFAGFMVAILDYAVAHIGENKQNELEDLIKERFTFLSENRFDMIQQIKNT